MKRQTVFVLVDANNFFASCERIFRPDLARKPVIVRSSNDGCVIARSNEAKALNIPMGVPIFKVRDILTENQVAEFSANATLYGDISRRLMYILKSVAPIIEVYSVDESFIDLTDTNVPNIEQWAIKLRERIWQEIGIPVSIGLAPTKTLAKLASEIAKKNFESTNGVVSFIDKPQAFISQELSQTPISAIWGIGHRLSVRLRITGISNGLDFCNMQPKYIRQIMGVNGLHTWNELNGISCLPILNQKDVPKSISRSRTLGRDTHELCVLESALASLTSSACRQLRKHNLATKSFGLFLATNRHHENYRNWYKEIALDVSSNDTGLITHRLNKQLVKLFDRNYAYHKVGVILYNFSTTDIMQVDLFGSVNVQKVLLSRARMKTIDQINGRFGSNTLHYASEDLTTSWLPKKELASPNYTTNWQEIPTAIINE